MQHALRMVGHVDDDKQVASCTRTEAGQLTETSHVVDRCPNFGDCYARDHRLGNRQELPGLPEVGVIPLPISFILFVGIIVGLFMAAAEITKGIFFRKVKF